MVQLESGGIGRRARLRIKKIAPPRRPQGKTSPEAVGARLFYLPPCLPDFNPIKPMWSKVKQILRSHAPRTEEELLRAARIAFQSISKADCKGFFFSAQYAA